MAITRMPRDASFARVVGALAVAGVLCDVGTVVVARKLSSARMAGDGTPIHGARPAAIARVGSDITGIADTNIFALADTFGHFGARRRIGTGA